MRVSVKVIRMYEADGTATLIASVIRPIGKEIPAIKIVEGKSIVAHYALENRILELLPKVTSVSIRYYDSLPFSTNIKLTQ